MHSRSWKIKTNGIRIVKLNLIGMYMYWMNLYALSRLFMLHAKGFLTVLNVLLQHVTKCFTTFISLGKAPLLRSMYIDMVGA